MLDASAVLAYLRDEPGGEVVEEAFVAGALISSVNWAEVLTRVVEGGGDPEHTRRAMVEGGVLGEGLVVHPLDEMQALKIARLRPLTRAAGLSLADRTCLALAASLDLTALTADRAWADLGLGVRVELIR